MNDQKQKVRRVLKTETTDFTFTFLNNENSILIIIFIHMYMQDKTMSCKLHNSYNRAK